MVKEKQWLLKAYNHIRQNAFKDILNAMKTTIAGDIEARIAGKVRKTSSTLKFRSRKSNHQSFGIDARIFTQKSARKGSVLKIIHDSFERRKTKGGKIYDIYSSIFNDCIIPPPLP